jgi:metal-responsive CopG/Arc/MetJ family transcriptional regulator
MARMNVVFEEDLLQEMRELVPVRQRSEFIEEAVRLRLAQLRQIRAAEAAAGAWSEDGRDEPSKEIEEIRRDWEDRQRRLGQDERYG